jgi:hydroxypyruvate isomerase
MVFPANANILRPMRQCFAWWSFTHGRDNLDAAALLRAAAAIGYGGVEMLPQPLWPLAREAGLTLVTMTGHDPIPVGFNDPANHANLREGVRRSIEAAVAANVSALIVFSGNRYGADDKTAVTACIEGLAPLVDEARCAGVVLLLETLNSKIDHPGYQCDSTAFGAAVVAGVGSPALRILYDAYHMQLMEGDVIRTIEAHLASIGHIHTGGVPGRRDLDDRQEVNWRGIANTLHRAGYAGWVGHEFIPRGDPADALRAAFETFSV